MTYTIAIPQPITEVGTQFLRDRGYHVVVGNGNTEPSVLAELLHDADALLARTALYPKELLSTAPKLKVIGRFGVGVDNIDTKYCQEHGIWVTIAPQANSNAVAEHTIGLIISAAHRFVYLDGQARMGNWEARNRCKGMDVAGKTLGLLGLGRIGSQVAERAAAGLKMNVIGYDAFLPRDKYPSYVVPEPDIDTVLEKADFLSLHMPATDQSRHLINSTSIGKMKAGAVLINCARGELVDETALYKALVEGKLSFAACDVLNQEPAAKDNPLFTLDNFQITPHSATLTYETMDMMGLHAAMGIDDVLSGRVPQWPVVSHEINGNETIR